MKWNRVLRKTGIVLMITSILGTTFVQAQSKITFSDILDSSWENEYVQWAVDRDVVQGYPDGTFKPNNQMTEAEWATMLVRYASNIDYDKLTPLQQKHWSQHLYNELAKYSLPFKGYTADTIKNKPITRGDIAIIVAAKNGFNLNLSQAVEYMYENELSEGMGNVKDFANYGADLYLTRAQATAFLQRLSTKPVTTFRGIPSQVAADEILGIKNPVFDGTKEEGNNRIHNVGKELADKYGFKADTSHPEATSLRDKNTNLKVIGYYQGNYTSKMDHLEMTLEMIQQIEGLNAEEMKLVRDTINKDLADPAGYKFTNIKGNRVQVNASKNANTLSITFTPQSK